MSRYVGIMGLLFVLVVIVVACGDSNGGDAPSSTEHEPSTTESKSRARTLPTQGPLSVGKYRTEAFEPEFSFKVGEGWEAAGPELQEIVGIMRGGDSFLGFARPEKVFDPKKPEQRKVIPAPETVDGWVAWYRENPYLDISEPEPLTIGGVSGVRLDATVASSPEDYPEECGAPCVPAFPTSSGPEIDFYLGDREEDLVLDVRGETVIVSVAAPAGKFENFTPKAQEVLDTVEWKDPS